MCKDKMKEFNEQKRIFLDELNKIEKTKRLQFIDYFFLNPTKKWHKFHLVSASPWPFFLSISLLITILHLVSLLSRDTTAIIGFLFGLLFILLTISFWFRDIIRESTYMGYHTIQVQMLHRTGFSLFLISEIMVFFGFFWAYFHFSLCPSIFNGNIWPPEGIVFFLFQKIFWRKLS